MILVLLLFLLLCLVEAGNVGISEKVLRPLRLFACTVGCELYRLFSTLVHLDNLHSTFCWDGLKVSSKALVGRVGDDTGNDILLEEVVVAVGCLENGILRRHLLASLHIAVNLIVETAFQFRAHTCELLRIERYIL